MTIHYWSSAQIQTDFRQPLHEGRADPPTTFYTACFIFKTKQIQFYQLVN